MFSYNCPTNQLKWEIKLRRKPLCELKLSRSLWIAKYSACGQFDGFPWIHGYSGPGFLHRIGGLGAKSNTKVSLILDRMRRRLSFTLLLCRWGPFAKLVDANVSSMGGGGGEDEGLLWPPSNHRPDNERQNKNTGNWCNCQGSILVAALLAQSILLSCDDRPVGRTRNLDGWDALPFWHKQLTEKGPLLIIEYLDIN